MKQIQSHLLPIALFLLLLTPRAYAQYAFGIESSLEPEGDFAKVSLPVSTLARLAEASTDQVKKEDLCIGADAQGQFSGYQADYDGDGSEELWLLYHSGPADAGCNVVAVVSPLGGTNYQLQDLLHVGPGKALIRPIRTLDKSTQMYLQVDRTLEGSGREIKGSVLAYTQTALIILTSWTQTSTNTAGVVRVEKVDAVFADMNFDNTKELMVRYTIHDATSGAATEKNMTDRYVLTLDYLPNHMRYGVYDSAGFDKVKDAEKKAQLGRQKIGRESTRVEGIVLIREALAADPFMTRERTRLGESLLMDGKYGDAEKTLLQSARFDPTFVKTYRILGDTYLRLNDLQKALSAYQTYLKLGGESDYYRKKVEKNVKNITVPKGRR